MLAQADTNCHDIEKIVSATWTHLAKIGATYHVVPTCHDMSATFPPKLCQTPPHQSSQTSPFMQCQQFSPIQVPSGGSLFIFTIISLISMLLPQGCVDPLVYVDRPTTSRQSHIHANTIRSSREYHCMQLHVSNFVQTNYLVTMEHISTTTTMTLPLPAAA